MLSGLISKGRMLMIRGLDDELLSMDEVTTSIDALVSDDTFDQVRETSWLTQNPTTVSAPPGFDVLQTPESSHASPQVSNRITPALPKVPPPGLPQRTATPEQSQRAVSKESKKSAKETILAKAAVGSALQEEDFPALDAPRSQKQASVPPSAPTPKATPVSKKAQRAKVIEEARVEEAKVTEKVEVPPVKTKEKAKAPPAAKAKPAEPSTTTAEPPAAAAAFPPLPAPSVASPARAHKTLRVIPTAKIEVPPIGSPVSAVSRAISHRPDTPVSELISDTASIVSASVSASRAGSPPPPTSRIGAAAVRSTTKSQQRKQRKDALKQDTQAIVETTNEEPEEHAPVLGRKKKQKKEKAPKAVSKPAPAPKPVVVEEKKKKKPEEKKPEVVELEPPAAKKGKDKEPEVQEKPAEPPKQVEEPAAKDDTDDDSDQTEKANVGPYSVFQEIKNSLWTPALDKLAILKPTFSNIRTPANANHVIGDLSASAPVAAHCKDYICKCGEIQEPDLADLRSGKPVRKQFHVDGSRMLLTPNGDCVRGLIEEEEDAFLALQDAIAETSENPGAFMAPRHQPVNGAFSLIKGRAVPNGRPGIFPASVSPQPSDPIGKLQREDALSYINQYVLPRLNLGATNVGWPKGASLRQDAAAASLNSLAPYFYGPDAAAGVGIYSAPDGKEFYNPPPPLSAAASAAQSAEEASGNPKWGPYSVGGMPLMSVEDAEAALAAARKETEKLEKGLNQVIRRNRRLLLGLGN